MTARDKLIEANLDLARVVARRVASAIPSYGMPADELEGDAFYFLVVAAEQFDKSRGLPFRQWALWFMRRRLKDGLRGKALNDGSHSQLPERYDVASIDESPEDSAARQELRGQVREALDTLPERSQTILEMRYSRDLSHSGVGAHVGLKASRVRQLHGLAIAELRETLGAMDTRASEDSARLRTGKPWPAYQ